MNLTYLCYGSANIQPIFISASKSEKKVIFFLG